MRRVPDDIEKSIERKGGLEYLMAQLPGEDDIQRVMQIHKALSDKNRIKILFFLSMQESCVCLLREVTGLAYSKISYHLKILKGAGLVDYRKSGNYLIYYLTPVGRKCVEKCASI